MWRNILKFVVEQKHFGNIRNCFDIHSPSCGIRVQKRCKQILKWLDKDLYFIFLPRLSFKIEDIKYFTVFFIATQIIIIVSINPF